MKYIWRYPQYINYSYKKSGFHYIFLYVKNSQLNTIGPVDGMI
jgi:hypothetical protein